MTETARLVVQVAPRTFELREVPIPDPGTDSAVVRLEACGVNGTDVAMFFDVAGRVTYPIIPGHEPVGVIDRIGSSARRRWGLNEGARVVIGSSLTCGRCTGCRRGLPCRESRPDGRRINYGFLSPDDPPGLWGGFASHLFVPDHVLVREMDAGVGRGAASFFNALGNGWHWTSDVGRVRAGETVLVLGAGPRGLAATAVAAEAGAANIVVLGRSPSTTRLDIARRLGAHVTLEADAEHLGEQLRSAIPDGANLVIDATSGADILDAVVPIIVPHGRAVLGGLRLGKTASLNAATLDNIVLREIQVLGARSTPVSALDHAVRMIESGQFAFDEVASHAFPLEAADEAVRGLAGETAVRPVHARLEP